ncbi:MAG: hypothetical protein O3C10_03770 [Chloroflexi bacterium]|nr:hypothetical protein [Chloroflexota bacterium]
MSPRAAARLETLGFTNVYDYEAGKADWFAAGLPREGEAMPVLRAADVARTDDVTCTLADTVAIAAEKAREVGQNQCIVVNDERIILGRLRSAALGGDPDALAEDVMELGPTTTRPDAEVAPILHRMLARDVDRILVATSGGRLIGTMWRTDAEHRAGEPDEEIACDC